MSYKIGSFNVCKLSFESNHEKQTRKNYEKIAEIIRVEKFDIVALQEVYSESAIRILIPFLGVGWDYRWITSLKGDPRAAEGYAYIWNSRRIQLVSTIADGNKRTFEPRIINQYKVDRQSGQIGIKRNPYYARFTPSGLPGGAFFEIRLINTHIRFKKGNDGSDLVDVSEVAMRKNEFNILAKTVYQKISDKRYGDNMPAYTILLGDYNLNLKRPYTKSPYLEEVIEINDGNIHRKIVTMQDQLTTLKEVSDKESNMDPGSIGASGRGYANNYDHFTFDQNRFENNVGIKCKRVDAVRKYYGDDFAKYRKEVSDHIPIEMEINLKI